MDSFLVEKFGIPESTTLIRFGFRIFSIFFLNKRTFRTPDLNWIRKSSYIFNFNTSITEILPAFLPRYKAVVN